MDGTLGDCLVEGVEFEAQGLGCLAIGGLVMLCGVAALPYTLAAADGDTTSPLLAILVLVWGFVAALVVWHRKRRAARKAKLDVYERGIVVEQNGRRREMPYERMKGLAVEEQRLFANGLFTGTDLGFQFWTTARLDGAPEAVCGGFFPAEGSASDLAERIRAAVVGGVASCFTASAAPIEGRSFVYDGRDLRVGQTRLPVDDLAAVDVFEGKICCWRRGQALPDVKLSPDEPNAMVLTTVLRAKLEELTKTRGEAAVVPGLGRILFERRSGLVGQVLAWLFGVGLLMPLVVVPISEGGRLRGEDFALLAFFGAMGAGLVVLALWLRNWCFRCHERGVWKRGLRSETELSYGDIEQFTYSATRHFVNGAYQGTMLNMQFIGAEAAGSPTVDFDDTIQGGDDDLDTLRHHISTVISRRMVSTVADGGNVRWGSRAFLTPQGVYYVPDGAGEGVVVPYLSVAEPHLQQGTCYLSTTAGERMLNIDVSESNFFPGYLTFLLIRQAMAGDGA